MLRGWTSSMKHEANFIRKAKKDTSPQFAHSAQKMIQDIISSADHNRGFPKPEGLPPLSLTVNILTKSLWPMQNYAFCIIPEYMGQWRDAYFDYWTSIKSEDSPSDKLKLTWQPKLGYCVIEAILGKTGRVYTIKLTTYQYSILDKFDYADGYTLNDLQLATGLSKSELDKEVFLLAKYKIVKNEDIITLNEGFVSRSKAFEVMPITRTSNDKKKDVIQKLDAYRRDLIEAATVRVLKRHEVMSRQNLIDAVVENLSANFSANRLIIDARIAVLVEQGYMTESGNTLTYKA
jgi:hypothetical protein